MEMIFLNKNISWFQRVTHGYFIAKKFFKGAYKREVLLTVYDPKLDRSCYGYFFICEHNVILAFMTDLTDEKGIYELEPTDTLSAVEDAQTYLKTVLGTTRSAETYVSVKTTNPILYININNRYLILCNIQASLNFGYILKGALATVFFTKKDARERVANLISLIRLIVKGDQGAFDSILPGITASLSIFTRFSVIVIGSIFIIVFIVAITVFRLPS